MFRLYGIPSNTNNDYFYKQGSEACLSYGSCLKLRSKPVLEPEWNIILVHPSYFCSYSSPLGQPGCKGMRYRKAYWSVVCEHDATPSCCDSSRALRVPIVTGRPNAPHKNMRFWNVFKVLIVLANHNSTFLTQTPLPFSFFNLKKNINKQSSTKK